MKWWKNGLLWFALTLAAIGGLTALGPAERSLGTNVRVVYLHGVWVWTALVTFLAAALAGLAGLLSRRGSLHRWSRALGRAGLLFWVSYLPISMWAMQTNWNGLFLAEPRWRVAVVFAAGGLLLQVGLTLIEDPAWASAGNLFYFIALGFSLNNTADVMHPPSPILDSEAASIQFFFFGLLGLTLLAAWQVSAGLHRLESPEKISQAS